MNLPSIDAALLSQLLPMSAAVDALEAAFAGTLPEAPLRSHVGAGEGDLLLMPAVSDQGVGVKLVTVNPGNPARGLPLVQGVYVLFAPGTLEPVAIVDGAALTGIRTAAVSGLATRHLARPDARGLVVFGAGTQARAHLEAMTAVRPIERFTVVSRAPEPAEALAELGRTLGLAAGTGEPSAVGEADIVCTCTTSASPVFAGGDLRPGAHVNAVGAYTPETRELDAETLRRGRVVVETREAALAEAGDLLLAIEEGAFTAEDVAADLSEVVRGAQVRASDQDVTVFKSVGVAFEDLVVARAAVDRLTATGSGA
ncbi:MAG TPA: ornithine cyclodeaminase family protein [Actinomycetota bacterium]|nr:ornithine cyclodeaminase family protein [Actinomycetota bacterium]